MIAVTGANGLLGNFIIRSLLAEGHACIGIKRKESNLDLVRDFSDKIEWRDADVSDPVALVDAFKDCSGVIHAAALVSYNPRDRQRLYDINVLGTRNVVNTCLHLGIPRLLHVSSVAALGRQKGINIIDEESKWVDSPLNSSYGESKYFAELEVFRGQEEGLKTVIVNPSVILAPGNWNKSSAKIFKYVFDQKPFFIDGFVNYVDVRDVASAIAQLYASDFSNQRFIANAGSVSFYQLLKTIAVRFNKRAPFIKLSRPALHLLASVENWRARFTKSDPLITRETAKMAGINFYYSNEKIKKTLNMSFQSIENSVQWCVEQYLLSANPKN